MNKMEIINKYPVKIFKREYEGKTYYKIGLSKKDQNGKYINGYIDATFRKDANIDDSKKIYIKNAWLDFYKTKDGKTVINIFINKFDYVSDVIEESKAPGEELDSNISILSEDIEIEDSDLPF